MYAICYNADVLTKTPTCRLARAAQARLLSARRGEVTKNTGRKKHQGQVEAAVSDEVVEETADIVVVGGGAAGMMAAITAAKSGADVLVIEKGAQIGVANGWNCGGPMASETSVQAEEGVVVTDEMLFNDLTEDAYLTSDSRLLRRVVARTGEAIEAVLRVGKFYAVVDQAYVDAVSTVGMFEYLGSPEDWYVGTMTAKGVVLETLQADLDLAVEQGWAVKADTIEECAAFFGMDKLQETVDRYNIYVKTGVDDEFFKNPIFLTSIAEGPFYVVEYEPSAWGTLGGLRTDSNLRVVGSDLKPIEGLYAAGVDAGSLYCQPYYQNEGAAVGLAFGSGILAAETMLADIAE